MREGRPDSVIARPPAQPEAAEDVSAGSAPWQRLAYDELLAGQLALALVRQNLKKQPGRSVVGNGRIRAQIADALAFALTNSQRLALNEIAEDIAAPHRMLRLLQGDVGSGKTIVALMAMAMAVEQAHHAALMGQPRFCPAAGGDDRARSRHQDCVRVRRSERACSRDCSSGSGRSTPHWHARAFQPDVGSPTGVCGHRGRSVRRSSTASPADKGVSAAPLLVMKDTDPAHPAMTHYAT